jgi:N-acetylglucosaminyldiphosphoundecaprenol N-acetyl-beta-D-mannosaminyltransferase
MTQLGDGGDAERQGRRGDGLPTGDGPRTDARSAVDVHGVPLAPLSMAELLDHVEGALGAGQGGWIVTVNLDILAHHLRDPAAKAAYLAADLRVADGMPLVWAARLQGDRLPERVAGSSLCDPLAELCGRRGHGLALLGGREGTAEAAARVLRERYPGLRVHGDSSLRFSIDPTEDQIAAAQRASERVDARVVLVGLGSPKQEYVIRRLRDRGPDRWFVGVGGSFSFVAGEIPRAPRWLQVTGLEWLHRLACEPRRLARRYLVENLPLAAEVLSASLWRRLKRSKPHDPGR